MDTAAAHPPCRYAAILFDCDGVLVNSEPLTMRVLRDMLEERGWTLTLHDCMRLFVGKATKDEAARIERETGQPFTQAWLHQFWARRDIALRQHLQAVAGAETLVRQAHAATGGRIACVSGADRDKIRLQLTLTALLPWFDNRLFSGHDMPRSKPHPDVYQAAMRALHVAPATCLAIEDTATGVRAAAAAGATVIGYCAPDNPIADAPALRHAGAHHIVHHLGQIPAWWASPSPLASPHA